ncbi:class I SAM-dependent methyltransferase [Novosphingobium sp. NBM11]|uniref:SAM-dependent methyltransferase n=1 Tax=Novosphingobium sp. NBM11 TaxID=2596914 RepID=UPI0018923EE2|nr:cyclopropane-fatty-acyl-phospholipid synthase family protein [Novosphingobium sp. NBM11]MBF5091854.1 class I SAM-dependent methyltransferase [Novosphingobium sp. NBM11]
MNAQTPVRGGHLVAGGRSMTAGTGLLARLITGSMSRLLDRIDTGLAEGSLLARLPDGSTRLFGARAPGYAAEITLHDWRGLLRLATAGSVGWYQAWEAGEWESPDPVALFALFMRNAKAMGDMARAKGPWRWAGRVLHALRRNNRKGARLNISAHYDLGNDFYACWLDPSMSYSSALWAGLAPDADLETAQVHKVDRLAERLHLAPGASVLEIGCGWGFLARRFAQAHGARVVGISLSDEQLAWARERAVPGTDYRHQDYRDVDGQFDAIASVEMVEAVGRRFWPSWFDCIARHLKPGGRAAIQFIAIRDDLFDAYAASADFIQAYVFPGGLLIRESAFRALAAERGLAWEDRQDFGADYARTLRLWREAFDRAVEEGRLPPAFDARFVRLWRYYLMYCEGGFMGGGIDVSQVTLVKRG